MHPYHSTLVSSELLWSGLCTARLAKNGCFAPSFVTSGVLYFSRVHYASGLHKWLHCGHHYRRITTFAMTLVPRAVDKHVLRLSCQGAKYSFAPLFVRFCVFHTPKSAMCVFLPQPNWLDPRTTSKWDAHAALHHKIVPIPCPAPQHIHFPRGSPLHVLADGWGMVRTRSTLTSAVWLSICSLQHARNLASRAS